MGRQLHLEFNVEYNWSLTYWLKWWLHVSFQVMAGIRSNILHFDVYVITYGSGHEGGVVLLPGFAVKW